MPAQLAHLPAGHPPGPQSLRRARRLPWAVATEVALGLLTAAGALAIAVFARPTSSDRAALVFVEVLLGIVAAVILAFGAMMFLRSRGLPRARGIEIAVEPADLKRGDTVRVQLTLTREASKAETVQIGLVCTRLGDTARTVVAGDAAYRQIVVQQTEVLADWRDIAPRAGEQQYSFTVDPDAPFSYEGATVTWAYRISARRVRRWRPDLHCSVPIWVRP